MEEPQVRSGWPLYEVFLRGKRGLNHVHVGSLHAADPQMALRHARDLYTRRNEGVSIWVVAAADITASSPDEKDPFFAPSGDKVYRHTSLQAYSRNFGQLHFRIIIPGYYHLWRECPEQCPDV